MIIPQYYYLDAATLSSATAVYLDELLTVCAPDGFYSDGVITREMVGCSLLPAQTCVSCAISCPIVQTNNVSPGIYLFNINTGTNTGAIIIKITPTGPYFKPLGVRAIFQSVTYNKLSSTFDGVHQSLSPFNYTFVGDSTYDCTPPISGESYLLQNYNYDGTFVSTGSSQSLVVNSFDVSLSASNPNYLVMIIPKPVSTASYLNLYFTTPCEITSTFCSFEIECPTNLTLISSSVVHSSSIDACADSLTESYYYYSLLSHSYIDIYDYIFEDINGEFPLANGWYKVYNNLSNEWIQVDNGVVINRGVCI